MVNHPGKKSYDVNGVMKIVALASVLRMVPQIKAVLSSIDLWLQWKTFRIIAFDYPAFDSDLSPSGLIFWCPGVLLHQRYLMRISILIYRMVG